MEATATKKPGKAKPTAADRELAMRLGTLMLHVLSTQGGSVVRALDEAGLTFVQMKTLLTLSGGDSETELSSVKSIAERLELSLPSASRAVEGLVKRGLVTREEDPDDRRIRRVALTPEGRRISDTVMAARLRGLELFATGLSAEERTALNSALELLLEREELAELYRKNSRRSIR